MGIYDQLQTISKPSSPTPKVSSKPKARKPVEAEKEIKDRQSTSQTTDQSINRPINQSIDQSTDPSIDSLAAVDELGPVVEKPKAFYITQKVDRWLDEAVRYCQEACAGALEAAGLSLADVSLYLGAQSQGWFMHACRLALGLSEEQAVDTFPEVASLGPATIPFNLARARAQGRVKDGDVILMYSPGVGLTRAAGVYRWPAADPGARGGTP